MPSFLSPLVKGDPKTYRLITQRTGAVIADTLLVAFDSRSRRTGLLKHESLPTGHALIIAPCNSIHMFFMKFAIDVAFVAKDGTILKIRERIRPWRMAASLRAFAAVEFSAGTLEESQTRVGDVLMIALRGGSDDRSREV